MFNKVSQKISQSLSSIFSPTSSPSKNHIPKKVQELLEEILSYEKLQLHLQKKPDQTERVALCLKEIYADVHLPTLKTFVSVMNAPLSKLYDEITIYDQAAPLSDLLSTHNVVIVPNHQSHADYVALNYAFYKKYQTPLYVAGGDNLNIFPIGELFRRCGCFFIRRRFYSDMTYKLTFESYLAHLLRQGGPIEFFFEGGRSRSGKLLAPKFGLYQMLLDAYQSEKKKNPLNPLNPLKPLVFIPTSICHEYVPEQKTLAKELAGAKKVKEGPTQIMKLLTLLRYQFGTVHIRLGTPLLADDYLIAHKNSDNEQGDKKITQTLAIDAFRAVCENYMINPTALLCLILLGHSTGAMKWEEICAQAKHYLEYGGLQNVPFSPSLTLENNRFESTLERAIDILITNHKIDVIGEQRSQGHVFYSIKPEARLELLYFKNSILHHFLVPWVVERTWNLYFQGKIHTAEELKNHIITCRNQLKFEFYLPTAKNFLGKSLKFISHAIGREVSTLQECLELGQSELFSLSQTAKPFAPLLTSLQEGYYLLFSALTAMAKKNHDTLFTFTELEEEVGNFFEIELKRHKYVRYPESFSRPLFASSLEYALSEKYLEEKELKRYGSIDESKVAAALLELKTLLA